MKDAVPWNIKKGGKQLDFIVSAATGTKLPVLCENEITNFDICTDWVRIVTEYNEKIKIYGKTCGIIFPGWCEKRMGMFLVEGREKW